MSENSTTPEETIPPAENAHTDNPSPSETPATPDVVNEKHTPASTNPNLTTEPATPTQTKPSKFKNLWYATVVTLTVVSIGTLIALPFLSVFGVVDMKNLFNNETTSAGVVETRNTDPSLSSPAIGETSTALDSTIGGQGLNYTDTVNNSDAKDATATITTNQPLSQVRNQFVATVETQGGTITAESVTTRTPEMNNPVYPQPKDVSEPVTVDFSYSTQIYPPYPPSLQNNFPNITLTAEVPTKNFTSTLTTLSDLGEIVELNQSTYDTGTTADQYDEQILSLEKSIQRLENLLNQATTITEIVEIENTLTTKQAELSSLQYQQTYNANQVDNARITITLTTPQAWEDYLNSFNPTWWTQTWGTLKQNWFTLLALTLLTLPVWVLILTLIVLHKKKTTPHTPNPT